MDTTVFKTNCPTNSQLPNFLTKIDFEDAFAFQVPENRDPMEEIYIKLFNTAPAWVEYAMRLRNTLVAPFGLKTEMDKNKTAFVREGEKVGIFKIYKVYEDEVIAGENDKHLDFRVSVHRSSGKPSTITVTTIVQYNNLFGKAYMTLVRPFHKLVVKSVLKSAIQRFKKESSTPA